MVSLVLSVGSNTGDRRNSVTSAVEWLKKILIDFNCSDIYETPCVKMTGSHYMNCVVRGKFHGELSLLDNKIKDYEKAMGRDEISRSQNLVPIDIDIVIAEGEILREWDYNQKFFQQGFMKLKGKEGY